jgi:hypothetical protein
MQAVLVGYVFTAWLVLPVLFRVSAIQQWHGYQSSIDQLMRDYGMTRLAAIGTISSWHAGELDTGSSSVISGAALLSTTHSGEQAGQCTDRPQR